MSNMKRVLELIESMGTEASSESVYMRGVADGLAVSADVIEEVMAELAAREACDNLTDDDQASSSERRDVSRLTDAQFEDATYEVALLDEDGDDAYLLGVYFDEAEAIKEAKEEAYRSASLTMMRVLDLDGVCVFTKVYGGEF